VALGVLVHIVGDAITTAGVPTPLLWLAHRGRLVFFPMRTGATVEKAVLVPLFVVLAAVFLYLNSATLGFLDPLVEELASLG
jgi:membrane-bound metal-dependent hydrolase YbcI (DUF457 family)